MDSPDSELSSDSSDSSTADPTPADSCPAQTPPGSGGTNVPSNMDTTTVLANDDSDSDVSMSADSDDEDGYLPHQSNVQISSGGHQIEQSAPTPSRLSTEVPRKRKYSDTAQGTPIGDLNNEKHEQTPKRLRPDRGSQKFRTPDGTLPQDKSLLPPEIWHYIFRFCPPKALGSLLQVNKSFNTFLDSPSQDYPNGSLPGAISKTLQPDAIWRASRLHFRHGMPGPLTGKSELDMWKLACGVLCQFCNRKPTPILPADQWHPGPGTNGVVPIWSFGTRSCGTCLEQHSIKEIDLLLSSSIPSPLMAALPFIFVTNELHVLPPAILQNAPHPPAIQIAKKFSKSQIEDIKQEFDDVKALGSAAAEEWLKGLDERGRERQNDAARWERWDAVGGVTNLRKVHHETPRPEGHNGSVFSTITPIGNSPAINGSSPKFGFQPNNPTQQPRHFPNFQGPRLQPVITTFPTNAPVRFDSPAQTGFAPYPPPPRSYTHNRHERTKEEVAHLKAARRAEIERRCMSLEPPLTAGVLAHMSSYQAAIQIIQPLDDGAWEVLKPRLLSQREEAEQRETDRLAQTRVVQERFEERRFQDVQVKQEDKDLIDREWDDIQAPLRARIGGYADEIIRDGWNGGEKVNSENCPKFAVDVLIYVRKRFYAEVAKDEAAVRATGQEPEMDPPNGPYLRKLILENMKWVFDTKIKPLTEPSRKELFLCNACEGNPKYYGFEGVIQHYAAKHTSAFSMGSIVVHWKSEWPEQPPFNSDPMAVTSGSYYASAPTPSAPYTNSGPPLQQNYGYGGYQPAPPPAPMQPPIPIPNPPVYQESSGPHYGHPQFGDQYSGHQNGLYPPPQPYQDPSHGYQNPQYSAAPPPINAVGYTDLQDYSQQGYGGAYPLSQGPFQSAAEVPAHQQPYGLQGDQYGQPYNQQPSYPISGPTYAALEPPKSEEYKIQLQDISKTSREVWNAIGPLKEAPGSIKVYTIIYHFLQRSRASFSEDPSLEMVIDGINHHKEMRACRNINGLLCKACASGLAGATSVTQKKHFSFPQLLNHFRDHHTPTGKNFRNNTGYTPDWTVDMIELPDVSKLRALVNSSDHRLKLVKEALPDLFAPPISQPEDALHEHQNDMPMHHNTYGDLAPSQDNHDRYYISTGNDHSEPVDESYNNGEYDPRNPRELPLASRPAYNPARRISHSREYDIPSERVYRYARHGDNLRQNRSERFAEQRPASPLSRLRSFGESERVDIYEEAPVFVERPLRYRDASEIEYRVRREPAPLVYEERVPISDRHDHLMNYESYQANGGGHQSLISREVYLGDGSSQPTEDAAAQQNRIFEVVAQISQQAQQVRAREQLPAKDDLEIGSEDGEVRAESGPRPESVDGQRAEEANVAAERFLNDFALGEQEETIRKAELVKASDARPEWEPARNDEIRYAHPPSPEIHRRVRDGYKEVDRAYLSEVRPSERTVEDATYVVHDQRPSRQARSYASDDRYTNAVPEQRERSPELVDRRYKLNNVIYRDERQSSHGAHRTPSRYARYESVRLENDRARSRSPLYVKLGGQPGRYREHSPVPSRLHQEPAYRSRTPRPAPEEALYEKAPRQDHQRIYVDEPRPREPREETYELVRVIDSQGEYMIRRPIRREPGPPYDAYMDDGYARQPVYAGHTPTTRPEYASYGQEEYDPRHPEAPQQPLPSLARQVSRYQ